MKIFLTFQLLFPNRKLITHGRRGKIYTKTINGKIYAKKKAISPDKKQAINKEAEILEYLKKQKIDFTPQIILKGNGRFIYEWIEGKYFKDIQINKEILFDLIEKAYLLDKIGVFHGELDRPEKNVLVSPQGKIKIIDFDRGKIINYSTKNLRHIAQYLHSLKLLSVEDLKKIGKIKSIETLKEKLILFVKKNNEKFKNQKNITKG